MVIRGRRSSPTACSTVTGAVRLHYGRTRPHLVAIRAPASGREWPRRRRRIRWRADGSPWPGWLNVPSAPSSTRRVRSHLAAVAAAKLHRLLRLLGGGAGSPGSVGRRLRPDGFGDRRRLRCRAAGSDPAAGGRAIAHPNAADHAESLAQMARALGGCRMRPVRCARASTATVWICGSTLRVAAPTPGRFRRPATSADELRSAAADRRGPRRLINRPVRKPRCQDRRPLGGRPTDSSSPPTWPVRRN